VTHPGPVGPARLAQTRPAPSVPLMAGAAGAALAAGALVHLAPGLTTFRTARCRVLPVLSGVGSPGHVALTFDDGPDPASTPAFLDVLDQLGWKATFFLLGQQVAQHPDLAAELTRRGHELGVHGFHHSNHLRRSLRWTTDDLRRAVDVIGAATGAAPTWFRPPYGALAASSLVAARRAGLPTVLWTTWGRDWRPEATPTTVAADLAATWHRGATVLLHDSDVTSAPGSWRSALGALPTVADRWAAAGLTVGPLADHGLGRTPQADRHGRAAHRGVVSQGRGRGRA
jgi:peptidoglycan/xylan/chitin deacetylase (PgdA/CDA1 family)